jgi:hypothetical protein
MTACASYYGMISQSTRLFSNNTAKRFSFAGENFAAINLERRGTLLV